MFTSHTLKAIYLLCLIPGSISFIYQLFIMGHTDSNDIDSVDTDISNLPQFEFKITWTFICDFLMCFGLVGYVLYPSKLSLPFAILSGCLFAYGIAYIIFYVHYFCLKNENKIPRPKYGDICVSTTRLCKDKTGTVTIKMNDRDYEYLAKSIDEEIENNSICIIDRVQNGIAFVMKRENFSKIHEKGE